MPRATKSVPHTAYAYHKTIRYMMYDIRHTAYGIQHTAYDIRYTVYDIRYTIHHGSHISTSDMWRTTQDRSSFVAQVISQTQFRFAGTPSTRELCWSKQGVLKQRRKTEGRDLEPYLSVGHGRSERLVCINVRVDDGLVALHRRSELTGLRRQYLRFLVDSAELLRQLHRETGRVPADSRNSEFMVTSLNMACVTSQCALRAS